MSPNHDQPWGIYPSTGCSARAKSASVRKRKRSLAKNEKRRKRGSHLVCVCCQTFSSLLAFLSSGCVLSNRDPWLPDTAVSTPWLLTMVVCFDENCMGQSLPRLYRIRIQLLNHGVPGPSRNRLERTRNSASSRPEYDFANSRKIESLSGAGARYRHREGGGAQKPNCPVTGRW